MFVYEPGASKTIAVVCPGIDRLHPGFDSILEHNQYSTMSQMYKRHRCVAVNQLMQAIGKVGGYTVMNPAAAPIPNVLRVLSLSPGAKLP